jgi:hypothetical protein
MGTQDVAVHEFGMMKFGADKTGGIQIRIVEFTVFGLRSHKGGADKVGFQKITILHQGTGEYRPLHTAVRKITRLKNGKIGEHHIQTAFYKVALRKLRMREITETNAFLGKIQFRDRYSGEIQPVKLGVFIDKRADFFDIRLLVRQMLAAVFTEVQGGIVAGRMFASLVSEHGSIL